MDRKTFILKTSGILLLSIPTYSLLGCSSSGDDGGSPNPSPNPNPSPMGNCVQNGTNTSISANHGHTLSVSKEDVDAAVEKTYSIQGSSVHSHNVTLTPSQFNTLKSNNQISVVSTSADAHNHNVTVSCA